MPSSPQPPPASSSRPSSPAHSRASSVSTSQSRGPGHAGYAPFNPSTLRESHTASSPSSPEDVKMSPSTGSSATDESEDHLPALEQDGIHPTNPDNASIFSDTSATHNDGVVGSSIEPDIRSRLLDYQNGDRNNGTFSRPKVGRSYESIDSRSGYGGTHHSEDGDGNGNGIFSPNGMFGDAIADGLLGGAGNHTSTTSWLAQRHGVVHKRAMYVLHGDHSIKHAYTRQVLGILSPCHQLGPPISLEVPPR